MYTGQCYSQFVPPSPSPTVSTSHSLCLYLYSCPANRFIRTIFLHFIDQLVTQLCPTLWDPCTRLLCPWKSPGKNTGVGCHSLLQGIFLTLGLNLSLLHWQADPLPFEPLGKPISKSCWLLLQHPPRNLPASHHLHSPTLVVPPYPGLLVSLFTLSPIIYAFPTHHRSQRAPLSS